MLLEWRRSSHQSFDERSLSQQWLLRLLNTAFLQKYLFRNFLQYLSLEKRKRSSEKRSLLQSPKFSSCIMFFLDISLIRSNVQLPAGSLNARLQ